MSKPQANHNATEAGIILLNDFRQRRQEFHAFDVYDQTMKQMRESASERIAAVNEPLNSIASRLFSIADKGFFLIQVCEWKLDYIAEAAVHSIQVKNPIALANNARALVEHLAALVAIVNELDTLQDKLHGQGQERSIHQALEKAEMFVHRAYYGKSPKVEKKTSEQALHVNDCIKALKEKVDDIEDVYDFLCEYVHPNYGSNALVSTGQLAGGRFNPPEDFHRETLDRLRRYCSLCMLFLKEHEIAYRSVIVRLQNLFELCLAKGATINNVFAIKAPKPDGDGRSRETAYFFRKARTAFEAIALCSEFLEKEGYKVLRREHGGFGDGVIYDVYETDKGKIWFKVQSAQT